MKNNIMHTGNSPMGSAAGRKTPKPPMARMAGTASSPGGSKPKFVTANASMRKNPGKK